MTLILVDLFLLCEPLFCLLLSAFCSKPSTLQPPLSPLPTSTSSTSTVFLFHFTPSHVPSRLHQQLAQTDFRDGHSTAATTSFSQPFFSTPRLPPSVVSPTSQPPAQRARTSGASVRRAAPRISLQQHGVQGHFSAIKQCIYRVLITARTLYNCSHTFGTMTELLRRWINEEIKVSRPVKSFDSDFCNGYLFGEILSRYGLLEPQVLATKFTNDDTPGCKLGNFTQARLCSFCSTAVFRVLLPFFAHCSLIMLTASFLDVFFSCNQFFASSTSSSTPYSQTRS